MLTDSTRLVGSGAHSPSIKARRSGNLSTPPTGIGRFHDLTRADHRRFAALSSDRRLTVRRNDPGGEYQQAAHHIVWRLIELPCCRLLQASTNRRVQL